jgi:YihY family inner membrane protein
MEIVARFDRRQRESKPLGIAVATVKKYVEDQSSNLASMIAFWAFFSAFPLFLVLITVLAWALPSSDKEAVLGHVSSMLPLLDPSTVSGLSGAWWAFVFGLLTALWSGTRVVRAVEFAFDSVAEVPMRERPGIVTQTLRSIAVLVTIGFGLVLTTLLSGLIVSSASGVHLGWAGHLGGYVLAAALDVGIFIAAFLILTEREVTVAEVLPGAVLCGGTFFVLQELSALVISHYLHSAAATYGHFATVITILWWFYIQSIVTLLGAQLNVVLKDHYYPRSLGDAPPTAADRRVLEAYAAERTYESREVVETRLEQPPG